MKSLVSVGMMVCALAIATKENRASASSVEAGTMVPVSVVGSVSSETPGGASPNAFIVASDIKDKSGKVAVKAGTPVQAMINAQARKRVGRPGKVDVTFTGTYDVDGQMVRLTSATYRFEGKNKKGVAIGVGVTIAWPVLLLKGGEAQVPPGQQLSATVVP